MRSAETTPPLFSSEPADMAATPRILATQVTAEKAKRRSLGLRWWLLRIGTVLLVLFAATCIWLKLALDRIERQASDLAEVGTSLNQFLSQYGAALKDRDIDRLMDLHADDYSGMEGPWELQLMADRDDVRVYRWTQGALKRFTKAEARAQ